MRYAPVGGGSYHWVVRDRDSSRWFATVDDLDDKPWLGSTRAAVSAGLQTAMDTAFGLRHHAGLRFVVAPVLADGGRSILPVASKYAVAVFPFIDGASGRFGENFPAQERGPLVDMLAALHQATPAAAVATKAPVRLPRREALELALRELDQSWRGGPFSEPTRMLLVSRAGYITRLLKTFDQLATQVAAGSRIVITHGEPHPANIIRAGPARMLIDWDTVGLAVPERDLWMIATGTGDEARRYTKTTGRVVDPAALALYRLRWPLDDISSFVAKLRTRHRRNPRTEHIWRSLNDTLADTRSAG
jgi:spectinomycin phosphotransferase